MYGVYASKRGETTLSGNSDHQYSLGQLLHKAEYWQYIDHDTEDLPSVSLMIHAVALGVVQYRPYRYLQ